MTKVCYYCGVTLTKANRSYEHIPPRMMFKTFNCGSIKVPSCDLHNGSKSGQDQAILSGFMRSLDSMLKAKPDKYTSNVRQAIQQLSAATIQSTVNMVEKRELARGMPHLSLIKFPPADWIRQITAGWVFNATKKFDYTIRWDTTLVDSPTWAPEAAQKLSDIDLNEYLQAQEKKIFSRWEDGIKWEEGWSPAPPYPADIYRFYVSFDDESNVRFKHIFYDNFKWYVEFGCEPSTREKLIERVRIS